MVAGNKEASGSRVASVDTKVHNKAPHRVANLEDRKLVAEAEEEDQGAEAGDAGRKEPIRGRMCSILKGFENWAISLALPHVFILD